MPRAPLQEPSNQAGIPYIARDSLSYHSTNINLSFLILKIASPVARRYDMRIVLNGETPLVFNLDDIHQLRENGIVGVLSGTLPSLAQQNAFLSVPLRLMIEELLWLIWDSGISVKVVSNESPSFSKDVEWYRNHSQQCSLRVQESLQEQRRQRWEMHVKKLHDIGIEPRREDSGLLEGSLFLQTHDFSEDAVGKQKKINPTADQMRYYRLYRKLRQNGFVVHPGGRFGGKYVIYPGDPLRFHSHVVISEPIADTNEELDLLQIVAGARLGTTVKKSYVISCVEADEEPRFYTLEWAGFG